MPDIAFRSKPVSAWTDKDFSDFQVHICKEPLSHVLKSDGMDAAADAHRFSRNHVKNIFDSSLFVGQEDSPFVWHRQIKTRLAQADLVNQDLAMLQQCSESGKLDALPEADRMAMFEGMASKMATIRYGYLAGSMPERAADYKSHMAISMEYGGVDMVRSDIDQWRSGIQEMLNSEYDKAMRAGSRYICKFVTRSNSGESFDQSNMCAFYDPNLLETFVQEYVADRQAMGKSVKDMYKFTTASDDYDLRYRITKAIAVGQGARIMGKEDWISNSKAQAAFSNMSGWGLSGDNFKKSQEQVAACVPGDVWLAQSKARMERADRLYEDLEALSELPLDTHGSLKYQPSFAMCSRCGWLPPNANPDKKSTPKEREAVFRKELFIRVVDALYGPDVAGAVKSDLHVASNMPASFGSDKNQIQQVWDELKTGKFDAVKDRVIAWSGERLDVVEQEEQLRSEGAEPKYQGTYHGQPCAVYSDDAAIACMRDVLESRAIGLDVKSDTLNLPQEDMNLMYGVYSAGAKIRGEQVLNFDAWHAGVMQNSGLSLENGEFVVSRPEIVKPEPVLPKHMRPEPVVSAPEDFVAQDVPDGPEAPLSGGSDVEVSGFDDGYAGGAPDYESQEAADFAAASVNSVPVSDGRNTSDLDFAAAEIFDGRENPTWLEEGLGG